VVVGVNAGVAVAAGVPVCGTGVTVGVSTGVAVGTDVGDPSIGVAVGTTSGPGCVPGSPAHPVAKMRSTLTASILLSIY
jgi:hypothetical protein